MALDVYVGPLTLYYCGKWENVGQAWARRNGATYQMIRTRVTEDAVTDPDSVRPAIVGWRELLSGALAESLDEPLDWDETSGDYATARPDHEGWAALRLWAAYADCPDLTRPTHVVDVENDPALRRLSAPDATTDFSLLVRDIEFWLPGVFTFTFKAAAPHGEFLMFASVAAYVAQLEALNAATWQADRAMIDAWGVSPPPPGAPLEALAKYAFAEMRRCAWTAYDRHMPMKLDY